MARATTMSQQTHIDWLRDHPGWHSTGDMERLGFNPSPYALKVLRHTGDVRFRQIRASGKGGMFEYKFKEQA
jgi:hypothetical protein